jgi:pyridoxamine 5'-phosphate oxidase
VFWWDRLERQVRIEGAVQRLPREISRTYFESRPRESQLGAFTSRQSEVVATREALDARFAENEAALAGKPVPLPDHWGGYRLAPEAVEFWQGRIGRLHDRLRYRRTSGGWTVERLEP